ncbi:uncharacterized protein G2W53_007545 [Senna tora]|uniref:Uncharacterized protein n=1 Tax=Senna tora TaxID=362788 RepID=A0A834X5K5_9FABA|nr:uncharacterized protein G2W53_007545 [Senna tora]
MAWDGGPEAQKRNKKKVKNIL